MKWVFGPGIGCGVALPTSNLPHIPPPWPGRSMTQPTFLNRSAMGYHSEIGQELCEMGLRSWNRVWGHPALIPFAVHPSAMAWPEHDTAHVLGPKRHWISHRDMSGAV